MKRKVVPVRRAPPTARHGNASLVSGLWIGAREKVPVGTEVGEKLDLVGWVCNGIILDMNVVLRDAPTDALIESLRRAMSSGRAPLPGKVRVGDARVVTAIQRMFGSGVHVEVGETPEVTEVFGAFLRSMSKGEPTLDLITLGTVHPADVARFCAAAATLYRQTPWEILATDDDVMCFDAPSLGLTRTCVTVMGQVRQTYGVMWIDDAARYRSYRQRLELYTGSGAPPRVAMQCITWEPVDDMPPELRREFMRRKWALAGAKAMPFPIRLDDEGQPTPFTIDDLRVATVIFEAMSQFLAQRGAVVRRLLPAAGSYPVQGPRGEVRVAVQYPHPDDTGPTDNDDRPEVVGEVATHALAVSRALLESQQPESFREAYDEMAFAYLGRRATKRELDTLPVLRLSLANVWNSLWRPLRRVGCGLDLLAASSAGTTPLVAAGIDILRRARVVYGEVIELRADGIVLRDLHDGARYAVYAPPQQMQTSLTRWTCVFGVLTPRADGRWDYPSVILSAPQFISVGFDTLVAKTRETLAALGRDGGAIDPAAPAAGLLAWVGVVLAVLMRLGDEAARVPKPKRLLTNSDGDVVEFVDAEVSIDLAPKGVAVAMARAPGFVETAARCWDLVDTTRTTVLATGESLGSLVYEKRKWIVRANSPRRVEAMLDRLAVILGHRPGVKSRTHRAPWEDGDGFARAPGDGVETVIIANGPVPASLAESGAVARLPIDNVRALLDQSIAAIGGVPRALVATTEGRARVEEWLRGAESAGNHLEATGTCWLDLDPLRRELGIPTVV